jgi:hypothetical protein
MDDKPDLIVAIVSYIPHSESLVANPGSTGLWNDMYYPAPTI